MNTKVVKGFAAFFLFLFITLLSFSEYYLFDRVPMPEDDHYEIHGWSKEGVENLQHGRDAQWYPNYNLGMNKSGTDPAFNPNNLENLILSQLPFEHTSAFIFLLVIKMTMVGFSGYLLLRYMEFSQTISLCGGALYMFDPALIMDYQGFWLYSLIFTPLYVIFLHKWKNGENRKLLFFVWSLLAGIQYCGGGITQVLFSYFGIASYAMIMSIIQRWRFREIASLFGVLMGTGLIALAIGAYIFIPAFDMYFIQEKRIKQIDNITPLFYFSQFHMITFAQKMLGFIFPFFIRLSWLDPDWGSLGRVNRSIGFAGTCVSMLTLPAIAVVLSNWKVVQGRLKEISLFLIVFYFFALNPILINPNAILAIFPFISFSWAYSIYNVFNAILIVAVLDAVISQKLLISKNIRRFVLIFAGFYFLTALLFLSAIALYNYGDSAKLLSLFHEKHGDSGRWKSVVLLRLLAEQYLHSWTAVWVVLLLLARGMQLWFFRNANTKIYLAALLMLFVVEYVSYVKATGPFVNKDNLEFNSGRTEENKFIQSLPPGTRIGYQFTSPNPFFDKASLDFEYERALLDVSMEEMKKVVKEKLPYDYMFGHIYPFRPDSAVFGVQNVTISTNYHQYMNRASAGNPLYEQLKSYWPYAHTWLILTNENSPLVKPLFSYLFRRNDYNNLHPTDWPMVLKGDYYTIYSNPDPLPRVYFAESAIVEPDNVKTLDILENPNFDWKHIVTVKNKLDGLPLVNKAHGSYQVLSYSIFYNDVIVDLENDRSGILVVNDLYYPYWSAYVNGRKTDIFPVNSIFRGVQVEAGSNHIEMHYSNPKVDLGRLVTFCALGACLLGIVIFRKER